MESIYINKFGADVYDHVKIFKDWMDNQPMKNEILAFINDTNPLDI